MTKGPWRIGDAGRTVFGPPQGLPPKIIASNLSRSDARLIGSAPDTIEVLEGCLHFLADLNGSNPFDDSVYGKDMAQRAKAQQSRVYKALQKVRG